MNTVEKINNLVNQLEKPENIYFKNMILEFSSINKSNKNVNYQFEFLTEIDDYFGLVSNGFLDFENSEKFIDIFRKYADYEGVSGYEFEVIMINVAKMLKENITCSQ